MKKSLLFCLAVAACVSPAMAQTKTPTIYPNASFQHISANGRIVVSDLWGTVTLYDLVEESVTTYDPGDEWLYEYSVGQGNCITADGSILLGSTNNQDAAYLINGEWIQLNVPDENKTNVCNGITPDGARICGSVGLANMTMDEVIMQVPVFWDRQANGDGYGEYHVLPYPTKDFFGDTPQYVTAVTISDDGKTIVGQVQFSSGFMAVPIVFTEDAEGNWSYSFPTKALFNPNEIPSVENPGESPEYPDARPYMTEENRAAYQEAYDQYLWPDPQDYLTEEGKAEYAAALAKYKTEYDEWQEKFNDFMDYQLTVIEESPNFLFNNVLLSTDGKYIVSTLLKEVPDDDPMAWFPTKTLYTPCSVNIATGELKTVDTDLSLFACGVADNGVILAYNGVESIPMLGYVINGDEVQPIDEYISSKVPSYGEWIKRNMTHEIVVDYDDEWNEIYEEVTFTGMPVATPDLSVIAIWNNCPWDYMSAEGVVFDMSQTSGIAAIAAANKDLSFANGELNIPAGFDSVEIFNLGGACVKTVNGVEGSVKLNLANGVYIAKGTRVDGSVSVIKLTK